MFLLHFKHELISGCSSALVGLKNKKVKMQLSKRVNSDTSRGFSSSFLASSGVFKSSKWRTTRGPSGKKVSRSASQESCSALATSRTQTLFSFVTVTRGIYIVCCQSMCLLTCSSAITRPIKLPASVRYYQTEFSLASLGTVFYPRRRTKSLYRVSKWLKPQKFVSLCLAELIHWDTFLISAFSSLSTIRRPHPLETINFLLPSITLIWKF